MANFWKTMMESISDNVMMFIALALTVLGFASSLYWANTVSRHFGKASGSGLQRKTYYWLDVSYTVFITAISMFPLFGMLGTVVGLIGLGEVVKAEVTETKDIMPQFFLALTSTAWGIIFSLLFKFVNSFFQPFIENQIEKAKNSLETHGDKV